MTSYWALGGPVLCDLSESPSSKRLSKALLSFFPLVLLLVSSVERI